MKSKGVVKIIIIVFIIFFLIYNVVWLCFYFFYYRGFAKKVQSSEGNYTIENDYTYSVDPPYYLHFVFSLSVTENRKMTREGVDISELSTDLIVWPKIINRDEYGIMINYIVVRSGEDTEYGMDNIMIDKEGNSLVPLSEEEQKRFRKQKDSIQKVIRLAEEKWGI